MTVELWIVVGLIAFLILAAALFSLFNAALTAVSGTRVFDEEANGNHRSKLISRLIQSRDRTLSGLILAGTVAQVSAVALTAGVLILNFGVIGMAYAVGAMTLAVVLFVEILPRAIAAANSEKIARGSAVPTMAVAILLWPLTALINLVVRTALRMFGIKLLPHTQMLDPREEPAVSKHSPSSEDALPDPPPNPPPLPSGLVALEGLEVSDAMIHRTSMRLINADDAPEEIVRQILDSPFTRMPVWKTDLDNIVGVVHAKDLLRALQDLDNDASKLNILAVAAKAWFVPETTTLEDQLGAFLRRKSHFAIVVDEYGEVEGLITLEDILEEIVGNIADEHDVEIEGVRTEADGSVVVDGNVPIRDLNRALGWTLPDDEAVTIAGLVIHETQTIPEERQAFTFFQKRFSVLKRDKNRIAKLRIRPAELLVPPKKGATAAPDGARELPAAEVYEEEFEDEVADRGEEEAGADLVAKDDAPESSTDGLDGEPAENTGPDRAGVDVTRRET